MLDLTADFDHTTNPGRSDETAMPAPGMLRRHYQPSRPLVIVLTTKDAPLGRARDQAAAMIGAERAEAIVELQLGDEPLLAARTLYSSMRDCAEGEGVEAMLVRKTDERSGEAWDAIWNRLERAASAVVGG
jgi:hypothetical protein